MYYYYSFDWTYLLVLLGIIITLAAQAKLKGTYAKYRKVEAGAGITGAEAARRILTANGIYGVQVLPVQGSLTDHYDPTKKTVNLSEDVYSRTDIAALGVAAHECGHAIQDAEEYVPLKLRSVLVPVANIGSRASWIFIILGLVFAGTGSPLVQIGILLFALAVGLELLTLPVEKNASSRALVQLRNLGILTQEEEKQAGKVLSAAALTYVAAAATALLQLIRLIALFGGHRNRRD